MARVAEAEALVKVNVDTSAVDAAMGKLDALEAKIKSISNQTVKVNVDTGSLKNLSTAIGKSVSGSVSGAMSQGAKSGASTVAKTTSKSPVQIATTLGKGIETAAVEAKQIQKETQALIDTNKKQSEQKQVATKEPKQIGTKSTSTSDDVIDVVATQHEEQAKLTDKVSKANQNLQKEIQRQIDEIQRNNAIVKDSQNIHQQSRKVDRQEYMDQYGRIQPAAEPLIGEKKRAYTSAAISDNLLNNLKKIYADFKDVEGMSGAKYNLNGQEVSIESAIQALESEQASYKSFIGEATRKLTQSYKARQDINGLSEQDAYIEEATKNWTSTVNTAAKELGQIVQTTKTTTTNAEKTAKQAEKQVEDTVVAAKTQETAKPQESKTETKVTEQTTPKAKTESKTTTTPVTKTAEAEQASQVESSKLTKARAQAADRLNAETYQWTQEYQRLFNNLGKFQSRIENTSKDFDPSINNSAYKSAYDPLTNKFAYQHIANAMANYSDIAQKLPGFSEHKFKVSTPDGFQDLTYDEAFKQISEDFYKYQLDTSASTISQAKREAAFKRGEKLSTAKGERDLLGSRAQVLDSYLKDFGAEYGEEVTSSIFGGLEERVRENVSGIRDKVWNQARRSNSELNGLGQFVNLLGSESPANLGQLAGFQLAKSEIDRLGKNLSLFKELPNLADKTYSIGEETYQGLDNYYQALHDRVYNHPANQASLEQFLDDPFYERDVKELQSDLKNGHFITPELVSGNEAIKNLREEVKQQQYQTKQSRATTQAQQYLADESQAFIEEYQSRIDQLGKLQRGFNKAKTEETKFKYGDAIDQVTQYLDNFADIANSLPGFSEHKFKQLGDFEGRFTWDELNGYYQRRSKENQKQYSIEANDSDKYSRLESESRQLARVYQSDQFESGAFFKDELNNLQFNLGRFKGKFGEELTNEVFGSIKESVENYNNRLSGNSVRNEAFAPIQDLANKVRTSTRVKPDDYDGFLSFERTMANVEAFKDNLEGFKKIPGLDSSSFQVQAGKFVKGLDNLYSYFDEAIKSSPAYNADTSKINLEGDIQEQAELESRIAKRQAQQFKRLANSYSNSSDKFTNSIPSIKQNKLSPDNYPSEYMGAETAQKVINTADTLLNDTVSTIQSTFDTVSQHAEVINAKGASRREQRGHYEVARREMYDLSDYEAKDFSSIPGFDESVFTVNGKEYSFKEGRNALNRAISKGAPRGNKDESLQFTKEAKAIIAQSEQEINGIRKSFSSVSKGIQGFREEYSGLYKELNQYQNNRPAFADGKLQEHFQGLDNQLVDEYRTRISELDEYKRNADTAKTEYDRYKNKLAYAQTADYLDKYTDVAQSWRSDGGGFSNERFYSSELNSNTVWNRIKLDVDKQVAQYKKDIESSTLHSAAKAQAQEEVLQLFGEDKLAGIVTNIGESANKFNDYIKENYPDSKTYTYKDVRDKYADLQQRQAQEAEAKSKQAAPVTFSESDITPEGRKQAQDLLQNTTSDLLNKATTQVQKVMDTVASRSMSINSESGALSPSEAKLMEILSWNDLTEATGTKYSNLFNKIPGFSEHQFNFLGQKLRYDELFAAGTEATRSGYTDSVLSPGQIDVAKASNKFSASMEDIYWDTTQYLKDFNTVAAKESVRLKQQQAETKSQTTVTSQQAPQTTSKTTSDLDRQLEITEAAQTTKGNLDQTAKKVISQYQKGFDLLTQFNSDFANAGSDLEKYQSQQSFNRVFDALKSNQDWAQQLSGFANHQFKLNLPDGAEKYEWDEALGYFDVERFNLNDEGNYSRNLTPEQIEKANAAIAQSTKGFEEYGNAIEKAGTQAYVQTRDFTDKYGKDMATQAFGGITDALYESYENSGNIIKSAREKALNNLNSLSKDITRYGTESPQGLTGFAQYDKIQYGIQALGENLDILNKIPGLSDKQFKLNGQAYKGVNDFYNALKEQAGTPVNFDEFSKAFDADQVAQVSETLSKQRKAIDRHYSNLNSNYQEYEREAAREAEESQTRLKEYQAQQSKAQTEQTKAETKQSTTTSKIAEPVAAFDNTKSKEVSEAVDTTANSLLDRAIGAVQDTLDSVSKKSAKINARKTKISDAEKKALSDVATIDLYPLTGNRDYISTLEGIEGFSEHQFDYKGKQYNFKDAVQKAYKSVQPKYSEGDEMSLAEAARPFSAKYSEESNKLYQGIKDVVTEAKEQSAAKAKAAQEEQKAALLRQETAQQEQKVQQQQQDVVEQQQALSHQKAESKSTTTTPSTAQTTEQQAPQTESPELTKARTQLQDQISAEGEMWTSYYQNYFADLAQYKSRIENPYKGMDLESAKNNPIYKSAFDPLVNEFAYQLVADEMASHSDIAQKLPGFSEHKFRVSTPDGIQELTYDEAFKQISEDVSKYQIDTSNAAISEATRDAAYKRAEKLFLGLSESGDLETRVPILDNIIKDIDNQLGEEFSSSVFGELGERVRAHTQEPETESTQSTSEPEPTVELPESDIKDLVTPEGNATLEGAAQSLNTAASNLNEAAANLNQSASSLANASESKGADVDTEGSAATKKETVAAKAAATEEPEAVITDQGTHRTFTDNDLPYLYNQTFEPSENERSLTTADVDDLNQNLIALDQSVAHDTDATQEYTEAISTNEGTHRAETELPYEYEGNYLPVTTKHLESEEPRTSTHRPVTSPEYEYDKNYPALTTKHPEADETVHSTHRPETAIDAEYTAHYEEFEQENKARKKLTNNLSALGKATESATEAQTEQVKQATSNYGRGREGIGPASLKDLVADAYTDTWNNYTQRRDWLKAQGASEEEIYRATEMAHQQIQAINKTVAEAKRQNPDIFKGVEVTTAEGVTKGIGGEGSIGDYFNRQLKKQANQRTNLTANQREAVKGLINNPTAGTSAETFVNAAQARIPYLKQEREDTLAIAKQQQEIARNQARSVENQKQWLAGEQTRQQIAERQNIVDEAAYKVSQQQHFDNWKDYIVPERGYQASLQNKGSYNLEGNFGEILTDWENRHGAKVKPETFAKALNDAGELIGVTAKNISTKFDDTATFMLRDARTAQGKEQAIRMDGATEFVEGLGEKTAAGIQYQDLNMRALEDGVIPAELMQATGIFNNEEMLSKYIEGYKKLAKREAGLQQLYNQEGGAFYQGANQDVLDELLGGSWSNLEDVSKAKASMARQINKLGQMYALEEMPDLAALEQEAVNSILGGKQVNLAREKIAQIGKMYDDLADPNQFRAIEETLTDINGSSKNRNNFISEGKKANELLDDFLAADLLEDTNTAISNVNTKLDKTRKAVAKEVSAEEKNFDSNPNQNPYSAKEIKKWADRAGSDYGLSVNEMPKVRGNSADIIFEKDGKQAKITIDDVSGNMESSISKGRYTGNETILGGVLSPTAAVETGLVTVEEAAKSFDKATSQLQLLNPEVKKLSESGYTEQEIQSILDSNRVRENYGKRSTSVETNEDQLASWNYFREGLSKATEIPEVEAARIQQNLDKAAQTFRETINPELLMEQIKANNKALLDPNQFRQYDGTYQRATTDRTQENALKGAIVEGREGYLRAQEKIAQESFEKISNPFLAMDSKAYAKAFEPMWNVWNEQEAYIKQQRSKLGRASFLPDSAAKSVQEAAEDWFESFAGSDYYKKASWRNSPRAEAFSPIDQYTADLSYVEGDRRYTKRISRPENDPNGNWQIETISAQKVGTTTQDWFTGFGNKMKSLTQYLGSMAVLGYGMQQISSGIGFVKTMDKGLTNIGMTMGATEEELQNLGDTAVQTGKDLSTDASNVLTAMTVYANAGETASSIAEKSKAAIMLSNVTGSSAETTAGMLQGATAQFGVSDMEALNTLEKISSELPLDFAQGINSMSDAISNAGSVANESGLSMQEFAAITGEVSAITRQEGSQIGNTLKTTMARISRSKSADEEVTGKDRSNAAAAYKDVLGYDLFDANGEYKDLSVTLDTLAGRWDSLTDAEKNFIAEQSAGTRGLNVFRTMMDNWGEIQRLTSGALSDMTYADENQEKWNQSLEGKSERLKASYQGMFNDILSSDTMGFVADAGSFAVGAMGKVTETVDNVVSGLTGWMPFGAGSMLGDVAGLTALGGGIFSLMRTAAEYKGNKYSGLGQSLAKGFAPIVDPIADVVDIAKRSFAGWKAGREYDKSEGVGEISREAYIESKQNQFGSKNYGWLGNLISGASDKSLKGLFNSFTTGLKNSVPFLTDFKESTQGMTGLNKLVANVGRIAPWAIGLGTAAWAFNDINSAPTKIRETASTAYTEKQANDQAVQQAQSFYKQNASTYNELAKGVNTRTNENISLTNDEYQRYLDLTNQIAQQFPTLTRGFDEEGNAILTTGNAMESMNENINSQILQNAFDNLEHGQDYANAFRFDYDSTYHGEGFWGKIASTVQRSWNGIWDGLNSAIGSSITDSSKRGTLLHDIESLSKLNEALPVLDGYDYQALTDAFKKADLINQGGRARDSQLWQDLGFDQLSQYEDRTKEFYDQYAVVRQNIKAMEDSYRLQAETDMAPLRSLMESQAQIMRYSDAYDFGNLSDQDWSNLSAILRSSTVDQMKAALNANPDAEADEIATDYATKWANAFQAAGKDSSFSKAVNDVLSINGQSSLSEVRKALNQDMGEIINAMGQGFDADLFKESIGLDDADAALKKFGQISTELQKSDGLMNSLNKSTKNWNKTVDQFPTESQAFNARLEAFMDSRGVNSMDAMQSYAAVVDDLQQSGRLEGMDWADLERMLDVQGFNADAFSERMELFAENVDSIRDAHTNLATFEQTARGVTGLDTQSLQSMSDIFSQIDGYEFDKLFELSDTGVRTNGDYLSYLNSQMKQLQEGQYDKEIEKLQQQLDNFNLEIGKNTKDPDLRAQQIANRDLIQSSLDDLEMYRSQVQGIYSDTNQFLMSRQIGEEGSVYDSIAEIFSPKLNSKGEITAPAEIKQLYDQGLIGTDEFRKAVQLTTGEDVSNWSEKQLVDQYNAKMEALYTMMDNNNPEQAYQTIMAQLRDAGLVQEGETALVNGVERGTGNIVGSIEQIAHALGDINPDLVETIMGKTADYGYEWTKPVEDAAEKFSQIQKAAEAAQSSTPLFNDVNLGINSLEEANKQFSNLEKHKDQAYSQGLGQQYEAIEDYLNARQGEYITAEDVDPFFKEAELSNEQIGKLNTFTEKLRETRDMDFSQGVKQFKQLHQELSGIDFENMKNWDWQEWSDAFSKMSTDQIKELMDLTGVNLDGSQIEEVISLLDQAIAAKQTLETPGNVNVSAAGYSAEADKGRRLDTPEEVKDVFDKGFVETPNKYNGELYHPSDFVGMTIGQIEEKLAEDYALADQQFEEFINGGQWPANKVAQDLAIRSKANTNGRFQSADSIQKAFERGYLGEYSDNLDFSKVNKEALQGMRAREIEAALKYIESGTYPTDGFGKIDEDSRRGVLTYKARTKEALTADEIKNAVTDGIIQAPEGMELSRNKINNKDWSPYEGMTAEQATKKLANDLQSEQKWRELSTARTDSLKGFRNAEQEYAQQRRAKEAKDSEQTFRQYEQEQRQAQAVEKAKQDIAAKKVFRQYEENTEAGAGQKQYVTKQEREAKERRSQPKETETKDIVNQSKATLTPGEVDKINKGQNVLGEAWNSLMSLFGLGPKSNADANKGFRGVQDALEKSQNELTKSGAKVAETANTVQQQQKQTQKQAQAASEPEEAPQPKSSKSSKGKVQFSEEIQEQMDAENERRAAKQSKQQSKFVPKDQVQFSDEILEQMDQQAKKNAAAGGKISKKLEQLDLSDKIEESLTNASDKAGKKIESGNFFDGIFGGIGEWLGSLLGLDVNAATYEDGKLAGLTPQHTHEIGKESVADQSRGFRELESEEVEVPVKTGEVDTSSIKEVENEEVTVKTKTEFEGEEPADQVRGFRELESNPVEVPVKTGEVDTSSLDAAGEGHEIPVDASVKNVDTSGLDGAAEGREIPVDGKVENVDTSALDEVDARDISVNGKVDSVDDSAIRALEAMPVNITANVTTLGEQSIADQLRGFREIESQPITTDGTVNWTSGDIPQDVQTEGRVNWSTGAKNFEQPMKTTGQVDWTSGARNFGDMKTNGTVNWTTGSVDHPHTTGTVDWSSSNNTIPVTGIGTVQWDRSDPGFGPFVAQGTVNWSSNEPEPPATDQDAQVVWENVYQLLQVSDLHRSVIWSNVYSGPPQASDQHHYIYWENVETGSKPSGGKSKVNGTAFVSGSALAKGTVEEEDDPKKKRKLIDRIAERISGKSGDANAKGNWGLKKSGASLVGELGRELVVRGSKWFTIGDNGAEMRNLKKGDIVFNHKQTEEIFKKGKAISGGGRGKQVGGGALSEGTAYANGLPTSRFKDYNIWNAYYNWIGYQPMSDFREGKNYRGMASEVDMREFMNNIYKTSAALNVARNSAVDMAHAFDDNVTILDHVSQAITRMTNEISKIDTLFNNTWLSIPQRLDYGQQELQMLTNEKQIHKESRDKYWQAARAIGLDENTMNLAKEGSIDIQVLTDQKLAKQIQQFQDLYNKGREEELAMMQSENSILDHIGQMSELRLQPYVNNIEGFESQATQAANKIDIVHAKGHFASREFFVDQYDSLQEELAAQEEYMTAKQVELENLVNSGKLDRNSQEFADRVKALQAENEKWQDIKKSIYDCENAFDEEQNELFDWVQDQINVLHDENEFLRGLFETFEEDMFADSSGRLNINGATVAASHANDYAIYMAQANQYAQEEQALKAKIYNDQYFSGKIDKDTLDRYNEVHKLHEQAITDANNEKKAIQDLYRDQYDHMLDVLDKVIDKKKEQLEAEKNLYEYQKKVEDQVDDINELEKIYLSLQNDDSEEGKARRQEVKGELDEAKEDLEETEYDQWLSDQEQIMDDYRQAAEETFNERLDRVEELLEEANGFLENNAAALDKVGWDDESERQAIEESKEGWNKLVKDNIDQVTGDVGIQLNDQLNKLYNDMADPAMRNLTGAMDDLDRTVQMVNGEMWTFQQKLSQAAQLLDPTKLHSIADHQWENEVNTMPDPVKQTQDYNAGKAAKQQAAAQQQQQQAAPAPTGNFAVGSNIKAVYPGTNNPSPIYGSPGGWSGWQTFASDPIYTVLADLGDWLQVKWHNIAGTDTTGFFKKSEVVALATGGYTGDKEGLAYLHPQEMVLNQKQFSNFSRLADLIPIVVDQFKQNSMLGTLTDNLIDSVKSESNNNNAVNNNNTISFNITMNDVQNPEQFVNELRTNRDVIRAINDITEAKLTKNSKLGQRKGLSAL